MKRISLEELIRTAGNVEYEEQYRWIIKKIESGELKPVVASGTNGKKPALYLRYWVQEGEKDYSGLEEELTYRMAPSISIDYYRKHLAIYEEDRQWVLMLSDFLKNGKESLAVPVSMNERSFEIWHREKFLQKEQGYRILKRCGLEEEALNYYETSEPLSFYVHHRRIPQNLLIIENKDTFYSMRKALMEGGGSILGTQIGTLIYGAGKGILRSYQDFIFCVEPYMKDSSNTVLYFGDLDYEGIGIFERLADNFEKTSTAGNLLEIRPFMRAYEAMLRKAEMMDNLPDSSDRQNRNLSGRFFSYFKRPQVQKMLGILESGRFLPQEMLTIRDFTADSRG